MSSRQERDNEKRVRTLLDKALDDKQPLSTLLRQILALGGRLGSPELRQWATNELNGYREGDDLPDYRIINAPMHIRAHVPGGTITDQPISRYQFPSWMSDELTEQPEMPQAIKALESLLHLPGNEIRIPIPMNNDVAAVLNSENHFNGHVESIYWMAPKLAIEVVLEGTRNKLVELLSELGASPTLDHQHVQQAVNITIKGDKNRIKYNANSVLQDGWDKAAIWIGLAIALASFLLNDLYHYLNR